ncbi:MAG TPA: M15 family metallopeptidase [Candidatus Saccharimonadales bacterium]|jgi:D-alanyl-D-alanine dipeptidase|nr:M15 family metallopeptidase [Candidatus Saccharimonadales bacterium]
MITAKKLTYAAIPSDAGQVQGWKDIPINDSHRDLLIPIGPLSPEAGILTTSAIYFGEHSNSPYAATIHTLEGSLLTLFARRSVVRRLVTAEKLLPVGYHLIVFDAYRPYQVQKSLYDFYKQKLGEKYPDMDNRTLEAETQNYVSLPSTDPTRPSPHNSGGAVDVAIISHGRMLDFGTAFDHGGEKAALAYYESRIAAGETLTDKDMRACNNRRLLFAVMTQAGFQPYFAEWWHFNAPESQMGAASAGIDHASFGAADLDENNMAHEYRRLKIHRETGGPKLAGDWPTEIIAPPES